MGPEAMTISFSGIIPLRVAGHRMPQAPQAEAFATDKDAFHLVGHRAGFDVPRGKVDVQRLAGVAAVHLWHDVMELGQDTMGQLHLLDGFAASTLTPPDDTAMAAGSVIVPRKDNAAAMMCISSALRAETHAAASSDSNPRAAV